MNSFACKRCGTNVNINATRHINYKYKDNPIEIFNGDCPSCGCRFFYIKKSETLDEVVFPFINYGFGKFPRHILRVFTSYVPIPELIKENKNLLKSIVEPSDVVIGFDGWEDIVINKELAGGWYMTYNSPPILDVAVLNCLSSCFGEPPVIMSYFPSPLLDGKVKLLRSRTIDFFESKRNVMLDEKPVFYLGIRE